MSNMAHCRFRNTLGDLRDCVEHIGYGDTIPGPEAKARFSLIRLCVQIALDHGDEVGMPVEEVVDELAVDGDDNE